MSQRSPSTLKAPKFRQVSLEESNRGHGEVVKNNWVPGDEQTFDKFIKNHERGTIFKYLTVTSGKSFNWLSMRNLLLQRKPIVSKEMLDMSSVPVVHLNSPEISYSLKDLVDTYDLKKNAKKMGYVNLEAIFIAFRPTTSTFGQTSKMTIQLYDGRLIDETERSVRNVSAFLNQAFQGVFNLDHSVYYKDIQYIELRISHVGEILREGVVWGSLKMQAVMSFTDQAVQENISQTYGFVEVPRQVFDEYTTNPRSIDLAYNQEDHKKLKSLYEKGQITNTTRRMTGKEKKALKGTTVIPSDFGSDEQDLGDEESSNASVSFNKKKTDEIVNNFRNNQKKEALSFKAPEGMSGRFSEGPKGVNNPVIPEESEEDEELEYIDEDDEENRGNRRIIYPSGSRGNSDPNRKSILNPPTFQLSSGSITNFSKTIKKIFGSDCVLTGRETSFKDLENASFEGEITNEMSKSFVHVKIDEKGLDNRILNVPFPGSKPFTLGELVNMFYDTKFN